MSPNSCPVSSFPHTQYITTDTPQTGTILRHSVHMDLLICVQCYQSISLIFGRITDTLLWLRLTAVQKDTLNGTFHKPTGSGAHQVHGGGVWKGEAP